MNVQLALIYGVTLSALLLIWLITSLASRQWLTLGSLILGDDGRFSSSKFQTVLWTLIVVAAYIAVYTAHALKGDFNPTLNVPTNLLILAGLSAGTWVGAGVITRSKLDQGQVKTSVDPQSASTAQLVKNDSGKTDLGKFQLIAWTLIAIAIFLISMHQNLSQYVFSGTTTLAFPDVDSSLLAFTGVSQAAYLGNKAASPLV